MPHGWKHDSGNEPPRFFHRHLRPSDSSLLQTCWTVISTKEAVHSKQCIVFGVSVTHITLTVRVSGSRSRFVVIDWQMAFGQVLERMLSGLLRSPSNLS